MVQTPRGPIRFGPDFCSRVPSLVQHDEASQPTIVSKGSLRWGATGVVVVGAGADGTIIDCGGAAEGTVIGCCTVC